MGVFSGRTWVIICKRSSWEKNPRFADWAHYNAWGRLVFTLISVRKLTTYNKNLTNLLIIGCSRLASPDRPRCVAFFFPGRRCADNNSRSFWKRNTPHTGVDPGKQNERTLNILVTLKHQHWKSTFWGFIILRKGALYDATWKSILSWILLMFVKKTQR